MPKLLTDSEIRKGLGNLQGWNHRGKFIVKSYQFDEFIDGIRFLETVARVAEEYQHHPDIKVRYTTVTLSIQTHSEGGVTAWDLGLARRIDETTSKTHKK
jgi:4a-hydroxytetrahydrobiopterin dehydratase